MTIFQKQKNLHVLVQYLFLIWFKENESVKESTKQLHLHYMLFTVVAKDYNK